MSTKKTGSFGEKIAEKYLKNKGYQILDRNYFFRIKDSPQRGEIDIIAQRGDIISFIEVKTSGAPSPIISPEEKVNFKKRKRIQKAAESWLLQKKIPLSSKWQIDVVSIIINSSHKKAKIKHLKNII